ncbi:MAG: type I-U CRISPR-associated protein Csx17 [Streptosporangiaceae bacterium]
MTASPVIASARYRHVLAGLRPEPLASYLAGLGLIRLLGEQADVGASAAWDPGGLVIDTTVEDIAAWLTQEYVPTPVLSPWNNGSGFGLKDVESKRMLGELRSHTSPRLAHFSAAIDAAMAVADAARRQDWDKPRAVLEFRNRCPDAVLPWIDAAVVLADDQTFFPPLLGTGGNDGRLDFSTNFHQRLLDVFGATDKAVTRSFALAKDLLAGTESERLANASVGQFDPAAAGGPGSSRFGAADSLVNPWAFVLLVEGALVFAASTVRRSQHGAGRAAIPFTVYGSPDGSASGAEGEESRGEIWVPVWKRPYTLAEIRQLFSEARASWHGHPARRAVEFYAATSTLGVARGVDEFVRYGLQRRNGLAFTAVPVDRVAVRERPAVRLVALVEDWAARARSADASAAVSQATRQFEGAHLSYARDGESAALRDLLAALTTLEQAVGRSGRARDKIAVRRPPNARDFLAEFERGGSSAELRIAVGLASCATWSATGPDRSMRQILLPVDPPGPADRARSAGRWRDTSLVSGFGSRTLPQVFADVLAWRSRTAADEPSPRAFRGIPTFRSQIPVPVADLHDWALGVIDEAALDRWLRACLALEWRGVHWTWPALAPGGLVPTLGLLHPLAAGLARAQGDGDVSLLAMSPDWASRLAAGQVRAVHQEAAARLRQAGLLAVPPPPRSANGALIAAALVPATSGSAKVLHRLTVSLRAEAGTTGQAILRGSGDDLDADETTDSKSTDSTESPNISEELS